MATFKIHGKKVLLIQHFNQIPDVVLMEYEWNWERESPEHWQKRILNKRGYEV